MTPFLRAATLCALPLLAGCLDDAPGRHVIVFVDRSCSVTKSILAGYEADWGRVVNGLEPGDRLTMGALTADTYTLFRPVIDDRQPVSDPLFGNRFRDAAKARDAHARMLSAFGEMQRLPCSQRTPVLDAVSLAGKLFAPDASDRILVLLSDMMEDAEGLRFDQTQVSVQLAESLVRTRRRNGILPDLKGAQIYISGAAAGISNRNVQRLEQFWQAYFTAAGGQLREYRPALLGFGAPLENRAPERAPHSVSTPGPWLARLR